jgi:hypothetical protein
VAVTGQDGGCGGGVVSAGRRGDPAVACGADQRAVLQRCRMFIVTISWYRLLRSRLYGIPEARMAGLIRDAQARGTLRPGFSADDLARIFAVNAYLVRDRPAGDDGWRRTLQFTLDGLRAQPDSTSK